MKITTNTLKSLNGTELSVYAYLLSLDSYKKAIKQETIANRCNLSKSTVCKAIQSLCEKNLIIKTQTNYYSQSNNKVLNGYCLYSVVKFIVEQDFIIVNKNDIKILQKTNPNAFKVYLYLKSQKSVNGYCFPSIKGIMKAVNLAKNTVLSAIKLLKKYSYLFKKTRIKKNKAYGHNLYSLFKPFKEQKTENKNSHHEKNNKNTLNFNFYNKGWFKIYTAILDLLRNYIKINKEIGKKIKNIYIRLIYIIEKQLKRKKMLRKRIKRILKL